ncbi:MAG: HAD family hydrolase [Archaeoglobus sp.]|nr:MAG: HAD family hydrolase [Archaeoglobus sp.]
MYFLKNTKQTSQRGENVEDIKAFILDVDGVVCRGSKPIPEGVEGVKKLMEFGKKVVFVSNNSTRSRKMLVERFRSFGLDVSEEMLIVATHATATYIKRNYGELNIFTTGEKGLIEELEEMGHKITDYDRAECLVVASNRKLNYDLMTKALRCCMTAKKYVATNPDRIFPGWDGPIPGTGMIIGALYWMTGRMPDAVIGKPSEIIMREALDRLGCRAEEVVVVGDQVEVDIVAGKRVGCKTALVLSGVTKKENFKTAIKQVSPDFVFDNLSCLLDSYI